MSRALALVLALLASSCSGRLRASGSGSAAPAGAGPLPTSSQEVLVPPGLTSAVGGDGVLRVDWTTGGDAALEVAVFAAASSDDVFSGPPLHVAQGDGGTVLAGLSNGATLIVGLGVRGSGAAGFAPAGPTLRARVAPPIYVDPSAPAAGANGKSPATAFPSLVQGTLTAFAQGGGNVWVRGVQIAGTAAPVFDGTSVAGGFGPDFDLAGRDPASSPTVLTGNPGGTVVGVQAPVRGAELDGLVVDGLSSAAVGVDATDSRVELRGVRVLRCTGRGVRLRNGDEGAALDALVVASACDSNGGDGLSAAGAFDLRLVRSVFARNAQEGVEVDDLLAPAGGSASLVAEGCTFRGNVTEGLDVDLAPPALAFPGDGLFRVRVANCAFEENGDAGLLVDADYESAPAWTADVELRGVAARANGGAGIHLDLDGGARTLVHRALVAANRGDGLWISSESFPGAAVVSSCAALGNLGAGVRASEGNQSPLLSGCVLAGNRDGSFVSALGHGSVASSVSLGDAPAWPDVIVRGSVAAPLGAAVLERAPLSFALVVAAAGDVLELDAPLTLPFGAPVELDDDGVPLAPEQLSPTVLRTTPAPAPVTLPAVLAVFGPGGAVGEDLHLAAGSSAAGAGLAGAGGALTDAGVFGTPRGGVPGRDEEPRRELFRVADAAPAPGATLAPFDALRVELAGGTLDGASTSGGAVRVRSASGALLAVGLALDGDALEVLPPAGGWPAEPFAVELSQDLVSTAGDALATPAVLPYSVR